MKRLLLIIASVFAVATTFGQTPAPITGSSFVCLGANTTLSDATPGGVWSSSNPSIAIINVSTGLVTGITLGTVTITFTGGGGTATTMMTVKSYPTITPVSSSGCVGSTYTFTGNPTGGSWGSLTPAVATINFLGIATGVSAGTTTIVYTAAGGCSTTATMTINPIPAPITGTNFVYSGLTTPLGDPTPGGNWASGSTPIATVDPSSGVVTGVAAGLLYISYALPTGCATIYRVEVDPIPATTSLYAWYPMCGDSADHSTNGRDLINHGIITTPATPTTDRYNNPRSAFHFNGVNSMMNYTTFFPNSGTPPDFTYSCWINTAVLQSSIIMYNGNPNLNGFGFVMNNGTMGVAGNQVGVYFGATATLYASTPLPALGPLGNGWHNLVLVKNGGVYNFYIDNAAGVFFLETNTPLFTDVFALGLNYHSTLPGMGPIKDAFNGDIDDVAVISRQLTNPERLSLFNYNPDADTFSLGNDTTICTDAIALAPNPQTLGAIYTWKQYNGLSFVIIDTTHTVLTVYPIAGVFANTYALIISKPYGCSTSDTINIFKAPIPVNLGPDQNVCIGDTINLTNFFPSASFLWSNGDTSHSISVTTSGTYYVTVDSIYAYGPGLIDTAVCVGRDTVNINFHAVPIVTLPPNSLNCFGNQDTLYTYADTAYTYAWNTGQVTDTIYATSSGRFWVTVNDHGCMRADTTQVTIIYDTVTFYMHDTAVCLGGSYSPSATLNPVVTYQWTPTTGMSVSNGAVTTIIADTSAEYFLTVRYPGCPNIVDSFHLDVQPNPTVFIGGNENVCQGDTVHITAFVTPSWYSHYIYSWAPATNLDCSTCSTVVFTAGDTTKLILTVTTPAWRVGVLGCESKDSGGVIVHPTMFDSLYITSAKLCPGDSIQLYDTLNMHGIDNGAVIGSFHWVPGLYLNDSLVSNPWVHAITSQDYRLVTYSQFGCKDTQYVNIIVNPAAVINLGDSVTLFPGESYQISPQTNCLSFQWFPPLGLDQVYISNPLATPSVSTTYYVTGTTANGCTTTDSLRIHIDPSSLIWIPNAFTPGAGINSQFSIIKRGIVALNYFHIFDRWGDMVYDSKNIDAGWDGTYKGKPQPFGVYVYELEAVTNTGVVFKRNGNVTLIR